MSTTLRLTVLIPGEMADDIRNLLHQPSHKNDYERETLQKFMRKALVNELKSRGIAERSATAVSEIVKEASQPVRPSLPHRKDVAPSVPAYGDRDIAEAVERGVPAFLFKNKNPDPS